jgi:hypothetical protein
MLAYPDSEHYSDQVMFDLGYIADTFKIDAVLTVLNKNCNINEHMLSYICNPVDAWDKTAPFLAPATKVISHSHPSIQPSIAAEEQDGAREMVVGNSKDPKVGVRELHPTQEAVLRGLHRPLDIIQGPPGTVIHHNASMVYFYFPLVR